MIIGIYCFKGVTVKTIEYKHLRDAVCDMGGRTHIRPLWKNYHPDSRAIIYLVDCSSSSDRQRRIIELKNTMHNLLQQDALRDTVVLVFADKQMDGIDAMSSDKLTKALQMDALPPQRQWRVQSTGDGGLRRGFQWLIEELNK